MKHLLLKSWVAVSALTACSAFARQTNATLGDVGKNISKSNSGLYEAVTSTSTLLGIGGLIFCMMMLYINRNQQEGKMKFIVGLLVSTFLVGIETVPYVVANTTLGVGTDAPKSQLDQIRGRG